MNNRQLKKRYKKLYSYEFLANLIKNVYGIDYYTLKIAFYDVKAKNIGIILDGRNHGYYDILDGNLYI